MENYIHSFWVGSGHF